MSDEQTIPQLPDEAISEIQEWLTKPKRLEFRRILADCKNAKCHNCQDLGFVIVSFSDLGPFPTPPNTRLPVMWHAMNGSAGWYVIKKTKEYSCPLCDQGQRLDQNQTPGWWEDWD